MLNQNKVQELIDNIQPDTDLNRKLRWFKPLGLDKWVNTSSDFLLTMNDTPDINNEAFASFAVQQAILGSIGNFNFWEEDGKIVWPDINSSDWLKVVRHEKPIRDMNMAQKRLELWNSAIHFLPTFTVEGIYKQTWWDAISIVYGDDPLKKRETLLWIILTDLGFENLPIPNKGCIDYNIILAFRYLGIVVGYKGNTFDVIEETNIRFDCLHVIEQILDARPDLTISGLDSLLYRFGRYIRYIKPREQWDTFFCYRYGCYFY